MFGYIVEVIYCSIQEKKLVNRGFLFGPITPIYGFGMIAVLIATQSIKGDVIVTFLVSMVVCTALEYFTSLLLEKWFHIKLWDYTKTEKYHLNGRICLRNSLVFGIFGCLIVREVHPRVEDLIAQLGENSYAIAILLIVLFMIDVIMSIYAVGKAKKVLTSSGDQTNEIKKLAGKTMSRFFTGK